MMAESVDCPCSNITIMQLFHELKQRYPTVPDQIVSKIIQENYHDKSACETILQRESHNFVASYPAALISGREAPERVPLCNHCSASKSSQSLMPSPPTHLDLSENCCPGAKPMVSNSRSKCESCVEPEPEPTIKVTRPSSLNDKLVNFSKIPIGQLIKEVKSAQSARSKLESPEPSDDSVISQRTTESDVPIPRCQSCVVKTNREAADVREGITRRWSVEENGRRCDVVQGSFPRPGSGSNKIPVHNYQVAVECSMQPVNPADWVHPTSSRDPPRSFTSVNLTLRPPSSEPQPPIEIQSGQSLTYTTSSFDPKQGFQSQLQIRIGPGGGGTVSACRTHISSPHLRFSSSKSGCSTPHSAGSRCHHRHNIRALLEKQRERRDLLSRELRKEKEKLRFMQNEVRRMQAAVAQRPSPHLLPQLKAEIVRLRAECERLTAAVDVYSDSQTNLPLGETNEEFYRNIYTGQPLQRDGAWSCHVCTFRNHALLGVCEECEMPRLSLGTAASGVSSRLRSVCSNNNTSLCAAGGTSTSASLTTAPLQER